MKLSLTYKFYLNLLVAIIVVVIGMFLLMQYSFDRGFLNYVNVTEAERLEALAASLETAYTEHGDWDFLRGHYGLWARFLNDSLPEDVRPRPGTDFPGIAGPGRPTGPPGALRPPGPFRPGMEDRQPPPFAPDVIQLFSHRVVLMDAGRNTLFGPHRHPADMKIRTLRHNAKPVGYLGLIPKKELTEGQQLRFVKEQKQAFGIIALLMACIAALFTLPLARRMVKRIKTLAAATHRLNAGRYDVRLPEGAEDELGQLIRDFNTLAKTLEHTEHMRRQWVGDISHELRTPIAVLRGEIEALQDKVRAATPEAFNSLHSEVMRLERLVDDLFQLSMSDIGALTYRKEILDPALLLDETVESFRNRFSGKGISIHTDRPLEGQTLLFGDSGRLQQLFENLLSNSLKYTDPGGRLDIRWEMVDDMATILWQDSTPGVDSAEIGKLFDRLYRVESSRSRASGGAGLGLSICKNIVEAHNGTITAEPSGLGGVLIKIRLPLARKKYD